MNPFITAFCVLLGWYLIGYVSSVCIILFMDKEFYVKDFFNGAILRVSLAGPFVAIILALVAIGGLTAAIVVLTELYLQRIGITAWWNTFKEKRIK